MNPKIFQRYKDHGTTINVWMRKHIREGNIYPKKQAQGWLTKLQKLIENRNDITLDACGIVFHAGNIAIKITDHGFKEQVINRLRKMNIPTEGL